MSYILLVEDDALSRMVVEDALQVEDFPAQLVCVETGELALEVAADLQPTLILMDIMLPGIDGLETTRQLRDNPDTRNIPVWAMTAVPLNPDGFEAIKAGCTSYLSKPINAKKFRRQLREFIVELGVPDTCPEESLQDR